MGEFDPPGTYRDRGWRGEARAAREDVFGAKPRQVREERAGSLSPSDFSFSAGFLFIEEKECIGVLEMMRLTILSYLY